MANVGASAVLVDALGKTPVKSIAIGIQHHARRIECMMLSLFRGSVFGSVPNSD